MDTGDRMGKPSPGASTRDAKKKLKRERWLLTRKTWRYMADAGRKLIPDGVGHHKEDLPKIEAYFQEVCNREPRFLLWRKQSYPGAFRRGGGKRTRRKGGSCRDKTSSADEAEELPTPKFDLRKMKQEFLFGKDPNDELLLSLKKYLYGGPSGEDTVDKLREQLHALSLRDRAKERIDCHQSDEPRTDTSLLDTIRRYYSKSTNRDKVISDILTDRKRLERLYFDLRKTRGFNPRSSPSWWREADEETESSSVPGSPPLVIEEQITTRGTQTKVIAPHAWSVIAEQVNKLKVKELEVVEKESVKPPAGQPRRSSVDNDDVSPSVSDKLKRYLRMARKKSVDSDKVDRFKRVNYDRNLRNIKSKGEPSISEDFGDSKSAQTDEVWIEALRDTKIDVLEVESTVNSSRSSLTEDTLSPTSPSSKSFLSSGQHFLSNLLHGLQDRSCSVTGGMQKSKSSTSVVQQGSRLVTKKIWKSRSKSQSRATPSATSAWTPQGSCCWTNVAGRSVTLTDTTLQQLTEIERRILQKVALAKLQALNLGVNIKIPSESSTPVPAQKPKRKAYLLKRKAITTGFFDTARKEDKDKGSTERSSSSGMVFGIPLGLCVENERARNSLRSSEDHELRRKSHHGSRSSFSSLIEAPRSDERGSCESLCPTLSMPRLDDISCDSTGNLTVPETGTGVPNIVLSCLRHLEANGLHTLGLFRVSSSKKRVRQLREEFDCGKEMNLESEQCPHDVATLLKEYFRDLPDSLLCKDLYQAFILTQRLGNKRLQKEALQHLLQLLPVANRDTLQSLLTFLQRVANNADDHRNSSGDWILGNKMDSSNLATLFAPNILHNSTTKGVSKDEMSAERIEERSDAINVIRCLIDNYQSLFQVSAELLDEVYIHMMDSHPETLDRLLRRRDTDELEDSGVVDDDKKYWSRETCTHESAATGGPDVSMRPRRIERGRERTSKKRRDELTRKRSGYGGDSDSSSRRTSDEKTRISSSDSGHLTPDDSHANDGVITASLKIPVPSVTSFSLNLDDIPFIEDSDRQQITFDLLKCSGSQVCTSESGVGSFSPPSRPPSVTSWGSTSPECEPTLASLSFQTRQEALKVTIRNTAQLHQVQPTTVRNTYSSTQSGTYSRHLAMVDSSSLTKSASTASVPVTETASITPASITSIGGAVLRSKTADIERMLRLQGKSSQIKSSSYSSPSISPSSSTTFSTNEKDYKRRYTDSRHLTRHLQTTADDRVDSSRTESRGIWKRREIISSQPKERRNLF